MTENTRKSLRAEALDMARNYVRRGKYHKAAFMAGRADALRVNGERYASREMRELFVRYIRSYMDGKESMREMKAAYPTSFSYKWGQVGTLGTSGDRRRPQPFPNGCAIFRQKNQSGDVGTLI